MGIFSAAHVNSLEDILGFTDEDLQVSPMHTPVFYSFVWPHMQELHVKRIPRRKILCQIEQLKATRKEIPPAQPPTDVQCKYV